MRFISNLFNPNRRFFRALFFATVVFAVVLATCETEMGMGPPVDLIAPQIFIQSPYNGQWMKEVSRGDPIEIRGTWLDNDDLHMPETEIWLSKLDPEISSPIFKKLTAGNGLVGEVKREPNDANDLSKGKWSAKVQLADSGEYRLKVVGRDNFKNEGSDTVSVRVDLVDPLVKESAIKRYLDGGSVPSSSLYDKEYYEKLGYQNKKAYQNIKWANIDEFQNEAFTLSLKFADSFSGVAASRIWVLDGESDPPRRLHDDWLVPDRGSESEPEWDITGKMITDWNSAYSKGPHFISFEVWAWNTANWENGAPIDGDYHRIQIINGTCWYPESDAPHIEVNATDVESGQIILETGNANALPISFFDDDRLSEIYAGLLLKEDLDALRGSKSEEAYLEYLAGDGPDNKTERDKVIAKFPTNWFNPNPAASPDGRQQPVSLSTLNIEPDEYRLIALVLDDKENPSRHYKEPASKVWSVYPPLKVHVRDADAPIIIIQNPPKEGLFPELTGTKFTLSGYTIDKQGVDWVQIAWVPAAIYGPDKMMQAQNALKAAAALLDGKETGETTKDGVFIWKIKVGQGTPEIFNGENYTRKSFSADFYIDTDFAGEVNVEKFFVFQARNPGDSDTFKSFRVGNYDGSPNIELINPTREMMVHDLKKDLVLHMAASQALGIGIKQESLKITDITGSGDPGFAAEDPPSDPGQKKRLVPSDHIINVFGEGARRTYQFEADDILGNYTRTQRTVVMSNKPTLLSITSSTGPGLYGKDREIIFEAVFSRTVVVEPGPTGEVPRLKLLSMDPGMSSPQPAGDFFADLIKGDTEGNTLRFKYTVMAGDDSPKLHTPLEPIDENGAKIRNSEQTNGVYDPAEMKFANHEKSLQNAFGPGLGIALDGKQPTITNAWFVQTTGSSGGASYFNKGKEVTLVLQVSEQVQVSGTPTAYISYRSTVTNSIITFNAEFSKSNVITAGTTQVTTLEFTYLVTDDNTDEAQLTWAYPWISDSGLITDAAENTLDLQAPSPALPTNAGTSNINLNGGQSNRRAFIDTIAPSAPTFTIHSAADTDLNPIAGDSILANTSRYIRVTGLANMTLYHSFKGGNDPKEYATTANRTLADGDVANKDKSTYNPSEYAVTAWQTDRAGNRSPNAAERAVTINSRAPELEGISCTQPDGSYAEGASMEFKLSFSRPVQATQNDNGGARLIRLTLGGDAAPFNDTTTIVMANNTNRTSSTIFTFTWTVPSGLRMRNINAVTINLSDVQDEYGNTCKTFYSSVVTETATTRPIPAGSDFDRPGIEILSVRPYIQTYSPAAPTTTGSGSNGGVMTSAMNNKITLTFDRNVTAQSGGTITVRPWGTWALPPILTTTELDSLYNSSNYGANKTEYQRRLKWVNVDGIPEAAFGQRAQYNSYVNNTNGLKNTNGKVRPDTSSKWVLDYNVGLYDGTQESRLREVFNAAKWKWQEISSTSGSVSVSGATVTITLGALGAGRIWEVLMSEGAFRDNAGNPCDAIVASAAASGTKYRFWSDGTATPVIRVDKYSHGDHYKGQGFRGNQTTRPAIDTKVRIDCETPGAGIKYDTIRTKYTMAAGGNAFTSTDNAAAFFNHPNVTSGIAGNATTGYDNNTIGNGGNASPPPADADGFFTGLLVPTTPEPAGVTVDSASGTIPWATLTGRAGTASTYSTVAANGTITYNTPGNLQYIYVGDANGLTSDAASGDTDSKLFTGRRDYIIAVAEKSTAVTSGITAGPTLAASGKAYEGVFKTTLVYRDFGLQSNRFLIQGFDEPVVPATPGFPLRLTYTDTPPAPYDGPEYTYYTKQAYRQGGTLPNGGNVGIVTTGDASGRSDRNNNYIWVSWDIVTDWYQMGKGVGSQFNFLQRNSYNYNGVLATYGAVTYRYQQNYTGGNGGTQ